MGKKAQVVALVDPSTRHRLDALRIATKNSRARVLEDLLLNALAAAETGWALELGRVRKLAKRANVSVEAYVAAYAAAHSGGTYGPGLDLLEADDAVVREKLGQ